MPSAQPTKPPPPQLTFREATKEDIPVLLPLIYDAYRGTEGWTTEAEFFNDKRISPDALAGKIADPDGVVLVAMASTRKSAAADLLVEVDDVLAATQTANTIIACCELRLQTTSNDISPSSQPNPSSSSSSSSSSASPSSSSPPSQPPTKTPPPAYFGLFAVTPTQQGTGLGRKILHHAEEYARRRWKDIPGIEMWVIWLRTELIEWYIRRGYRRTGGRREFPPEVLYQGVALRDDLYFEVLRKDF